MVQLEAESVNGLYMTFVREKLKEMGLGCASQSALVWRGRGFMRGVGEGLPGL